MNPDSGAKDASVNDMQNKDFKKESTIGMKKRILIFSLAYFPHVGGAEIAVKEITERIQDIEFDMVTLRFSSQDSRVEKVGNVTVYRVGFGIGKLDKLLFPFLASAKGRSLHAKSRYDAVWGIMAAYAGFAASFFKRTDPDVPFILTLQEGDPIDYIERKIQPIHGAFKAIFTRADQLQSISQYLARWAKKSGFNGEPIVIPNGVNVSHFAEARHPVLEGNQFVLTTVSRLVKKNGIDTVIRALPLLPEHITFHIYGTGSDEGKLKALAQELAVEERVRFLGWASHEELPDKLREADVFIRPSRSEGMGNSFVEAMAAGLPVIATEVGGIPDFLTHEKTGLFVEVDSPKSIAEQVTRLIENPSLRDELIANAQALVAAKYDWDVVADSMEKRVFKPILLY